MLNEERNKFNPLTSNDPYRGRTAPLTSKRCIFYIYWTTIGTEYFKHTVNSPFSPSSKCSLFHNSKVFGSCIIHILYTGCAKIKKIFPASKCWTISKISSRFWDIMQCRLVFSYRRFRTTCRFHREGSSSSTTHRRFHLQCGEGQKPLINLRQVTKIRFEHDAYWTLPNVSFWWRGKTGCLLLSGKNRGLCLSGYQWSQSLFSFISVTSGDSEKCPIFLSACKTNTICFL